jgi:DnaJ-class molecular chaperone
MRRKTCPSCKGRGHAYRPETLLNVVAIILAPFERNDRDGYTRKECPQCWGRGWVRRTK